MSSDSRDPIQRKRSRSSDDDEDDDEDDDDESHGDSYHDNDLDAGVDGEGDHSESETDALGSPSSGSRRRHSANSNALKTKQWREKQKLLHEKRKDDLNKVHEENARLRRENEELRKKMLLLEGTGPLIPQATASSVGISDLKSAAGAGQSPCVVAGTGASIPSGVGGCAVAEDNPNTPTGVAQQTCAGKGDSAGAKSITQTSTATKHGTSSVDASVSASDSVKNSAATGLGNATFPPNIASLLAVGSSTDSNSSRQDPSSLSALLSGNNGKADAVGGLPLGNDNNELLAKILALQRNQQAATSVQPSSLNAASGGGDLDALKRALLLQQQQYSVLNPLLAGQLSAGIQRSHQEASLAARLDAIQRASNAGSAANLQSAIAAQTLLEESRRQQVDASLRLALQRQLQGGIASLGPTGINSYVLAALQQRHQQSSSATDALPGSSSANVRSQGSAGQQGTSPQQGTPPNLSNLSESQLLALLAAKQNQDYQKQSGKS